ncbi:MAG: IS200/IS605 family transposase [Saprospiraceae bacterium]
MPYIKIWIHLVWSTKNREPYLQGKELRKKVWQHIKENAASKDIYLDCVNGYYDHVHCLMSLKSDQTIAKNMQLIKGESSFWINKEKLIPHKFKWQEEYFAVSVSHSMVDKVRGYIHKQEQHHSKKAFENEYQEFIEKYGFEKFKDLE